MFDETFQELGKIPTASEFCRRHEYAYRKITGGLYNQSIASWFAYLKHRGYIPADYIQEARVRKRVVYPDGSIEYYTRKDVIGGIRVGTYVQKVAPEVTTLAGHGKQLGITREGIRQIVSPEDVRHLSKTRTLVSFTAVKHALSQPVHSPHTTLVSIARVAMLLDTTKEAIEHLIASGKIDGRTINGHVMIRVKSLQAVLSEN